MANVSVDVVAVDDAIEERDEAALRDVAAEDAVDLLAELGGLGRVRGKGADRRLKVRHQQRRGNALADDVGDGQAEPRWTERDGVEAVAADA